MKSIFRRSLVPCSSTVCEQLGLDVRVNHTHGIAETMTVLRGIAVANAKASKPIFPIDKT